MACSIEPVLRLAQDTRIQTDERINAGLYSYARMHGVTTDDARRVLTSKSNIKYSLERELRKEFWRRNKQLTVNILKNNISSVDMTTRLRIMKLSIVLSIISTTLSVYMYTKSIN